MEKKEFYVYEWYNTVTNEVFYVGKGTKNRYKNITKRNKYFLDYIKENSVDVRKVYEDLTEEEAFQLEFELTSKYKNIGQCKCCLAKGGTGGKSSVWTDDFKEYWSKNNPMKEEKQRQRMRENNPMYNADVVLKNAKKHKRPVVINGKYYEGVIDAAIANNVRDVTISNWCKRGYDTNGNPCHYADEEQKEYILPSNCKGVIIDKINYYPSLKEAAKALGAKDSSPLCKALKTNHIYKNHLCEYADQQPSQ